MIRCSDSWNFMFIRLFVQELFHFVFHKKWKNFTVLKCHIIFDHVHICYKSLMKMLEFCLTFTVKVLEMDELHLNYRAEL